MHRFLSSLGCVCVLTAAVSAQVMSPAARRVRGPIRDAGTLHLATGEWSAPAAASSRPGATIFNNDAAQPFFLDVGPRQKIADFGRIPAATSSAPSIGSEIGQTVNGFQFAYTTREVRGEFGYVITFYDNYAACDGLRGRPVAARIRLTDLPGARDRGQRANWKVTVDLSHSAYEFILGRDGEGGGADARFGWSLVNTSNANGPGGPILAGDPLGAFGPAAGEGRGTDWNGDDGVPGTGLGTEDSFWIHDRDRGGQRGCVSGIRNAPISYASFHLQLYADSDQALAGSTNIGTNYCEGSTTPLVFGDDFESGDAEEGDWEVTGPSTYVTDWMPGGGDYCARIGRGGRFIKHFSTVGLNQLTLQYARRAEPANSEQRLWVEWWDGAAWSVLETVGGQNWNTRSFDLPPAASNNPDFQIRFRFSGPAAGGGQAYADSVELVAQGIGHIEAFGSLSVADNDLTLAATDLPAGTFGLFFYGPDEVLIPLGDGFRCAGGARTQRLNPAQLADPSGAVSLDLDLTREPVSSTITQLVPLTMNFQYWHRAGAGGSDLTDALRIHFVE